MSKPRSRSRSGMTTPEIIASREGEVDWPSLSAPLAREGRAIYRGFYTFSRLEAENLHRAKERK